MEEERMGKDKGGGGDEGRSNNHHHHRQHHQDQVKQQGEGGMTGGESPPSNSSKNAKSCKGCLYYSSTLKSNSRNPLCVGVTRTLPRVPRYIVGESEVEASKEGRRLTDFKYGCVGYSVFPVAKGQSTDTQDTKAELPVCVGVEVLVDKRVTTADTAPAHVRSREDGHGVPQPRTHKPAHSIGDEFLSRFTRNASLVATGVGKNLRRVGNHIKERFDDILYPYRRRPK